MSITEIQKKAAQAVVNIFETGAAMGDYAKVTLLPGDSGHLTYGRAQTTLASGNLFLLIKRYVTAAEAAFARHLEPYLARLDDIDVSLDFDTAFKTLLSDAGDDPVMHEVQDHFFDDAYWAPAQRAAEALGLALPLSLSIIYDSHIHGSWAYLKERTISRHGAPSALGEKKWVTAYVKERRDWLAGHNNPLLRKTVYRMDTYLSLIEADNWALKLPFVARGVRIDEDALAIGAAVRASAEDPGLRTLKLTDPPMSGADVKALENALVAMGYAINVDGFFDESLERIVKERQQELGLSVDGKVGPITRAAFGL